MNFLENEFFLLAITFGIFFLAKLLQKKTGIMLLNPILLTIAILIIFLKMTNISYDTYNIEMIIAIAFRVCSKESALFRWFIINEISTTKRETSITLFVSCGKSNNLWYS